MKPIVIVIIVDQALPPDPLEIVHQQPEPIQTRANKPKKWLASQWRGRGKDPGQIVDWYPGAE